MAKEIIDLTLPPIVFLDGWSADGDTLEGRTVLLHVRSASVVEILEADAAHLKAGTPVFEFSFTNGYGIDEHMVAAAHYIHGGMDDGNDGLAEHVLRECAEYYIRYCAWEDANIDMERRGWRN